MCPRCCIGTSGWDYDHWRGRFYPSELRQTQWFEYYARHFSTVEINNTFYRLPAERTLERWRDQAPREFTYAIKASRYITHVRYLKECNKPVARLLQRVRRLEDHLGPVLYQLPPRWGPNPERLKQFAGLLPSDLVHVFEFRNGRWFTEQIRDILEQRRLGFCIFDLPEVACPTWVTNQVAYIRFHGSNRLDGGRYDHSALKAWALRIDGFLEQGLDVYAYFNNDAFGYAVESARVLRGMVGGETG